MAILTLGQKILTDIIQELLFFYLNFILLPIMHFPRGNYNIQHKILELSMGLKNSKPSPLKSLKSQPQDYFENEDNASCCGLGSTSLKRKNLISWENNAISFCQRYKTSTQWSDDMAKKIKKINRIPNANSNKKMFIKEFYDLRYFQELPRESQKKKSLTPRQIQIFQINLRNSVLLHYDEVKHPSQIGTKESKIQKSIVEPNFISQIKNNKKSIHINKSQDNVQKMMNLRGSFLKNNVKASKADLRESILKFVDDTMTSIFKGQQKQISKFSAHSLQVFVKFTIMLEKHLTNPQHQIFHLIQTFYNNIYSAFPIKQETEIKNNESSKEVSSIREESEINVLQMQSFIENIKIFIGLLVEVVLDYYNIKSLDQNELNNNYLIKNYENLLTIVTAILFKNQKFYNFVFQFARSFNRQIDNQFKSKYNQLHGKTPQFFNIKRQYCLNESTVKKFIDDMSSIQSNIQNLSPEHLQTDIQLPFQACSSALVKLAQAKTPVAKMKAILSCAQKITESISEFYRKNDMELKKNLLDADQVLSIFCYILSIYQIESINSHIFLIEHFATEHQKISMTGYYFSVLSCAIEDFLGKNCEQQQKCVEKSVLGKKSDKMNSSEIQSSEKLPHFIKDREFSEITFNLEGDIKVLTLQKSDGKSMLTSFGDNYNIQE